MKKKLLSISVVLAIFFSACTEVEEPLIDNPYDPIYENPVDPKANITKAPDADSEINTTSATFSWEGTSNNSSFAYMLEGVDEDYQDWTQSKSVSYDNLDEGSYIFLVKERYVNSVEQSAPTERSFNVNAIQNFALILEKMHTEAPSGSSFSINVNIEEASRLTGLTTIINYNSDRLSFQSAIGNTNVSNINSIGALAKELEPGKIELNILLMGTNGGFDGNASLCSLNFTSNSDNQSIIEIDNSQTILRDDRNDNISNVINRSATVN